MYFLHTNFAYIMCILQLYFELNSTLLKGNMGVDSQ